MRLLPRVYLEDADVHEFDELQSLCARIKSKGAVINLVGVLHDKPAMPYGKVFKAAHVDLSKNIITAMQLHGLKRYLHMSALGADSYGFSGLPGGWKDGATSTFLGKRAQFWTSTDYNATVSGAAVRFTLYHDSNDFVRASDQKYFAFSIRCIKN